MRRFSDIFIEKIRTHNSNSINILSENCDVYEMCTILLYDKNGHIKR